MQTEENKKIQRRRSAWILIFVIFVAFACFLKIMHLTIWERATFNGTSKQCLDMTVPGWDTTALAKDSTCKCFVKQNDLRPVRGQIYDDKGRLLAANFNIFDITVDGHMLSPKIYNKGQKEIVNDTINCGHGRKISRYGEPQKVDALVEELSAAFYQHFHLRWPNRDVNYYRKKFSKAIKEEKNVQVLASNVVKESQWITPDDTAFIATLPLLCRKAKGGLSYTTNRMRINPYGEMGKRTIGMNYVPKDSTMPKRQYGIEAAFNEYLEGKTGAQKFLYYNKARIPLNDRIEPTDGYDIQTTINLEIQNIVHNELQNILIDQHAEWGCAVVMETKTGEIRAISNLRAANSERTAYVEGEKNFALSSMVEPGSTFKLASLLAYLERTQCDTCKKYPIWEHTFVRKNKNGREFKYYKFDKKGHTEGQGLPIEAFQRSSNVGIASMIFDKYSIDHYEDYLKKIDSMYITTSFVTQLGKINSPNIKRKASDFHSYYNTCFGTGFTMTPIQTLIYYNAVANNGKMILPLFVKSITSQEDTIAKFEAEVICEQICKPSTIKRAKKYLEAVVYGDFGTGRTYRNIPAVRFAGKTGTRDIWDEETGTYLKNKNSVSFCGYFPAEDPQYTCIVFIYNIPIKSSVAVKAFAKIAKGIVEETAIVELPDVPKEKGRQLPRFRPIPTQQLSVLLKAYGLKGDAGKYKSPYVCGGYNQDYSIFIKEFPVDAKASLPNLTGLNAADAVYELAKRGRRAKLHGTGFVKSFAVMEDGKTVLLELEPN